MSHGYLPVGRLDHHIPQGTKTTLDGIRVWSALHSMGHKHVIPSHEKQKETEATEEVTSN